MPLARLRQAQHTGGGSHASRELLNSWSPCFPWQSPPCEYSEFPQSEHLCAANRADTADCMAIIFEYALRGVFDFYLSFTLHAISCCHSVSSFKAGINPATTVVLFCMPW